MSSPKQKAYLVCPYCSSDIVSAVKLSQILDKALTEQAKEILNKMDEKVRMFRLKRTGQQEVSIMVRELRDDFLKEVK